MEFFNAVQARFSYRGRFLPDPVPREHLKAIVEAGLMAPSGCNLQSTHIVGVDDPALLEKLSATLNKSSVATAPAAIVVLTHRVLSRDGKEYAVQDYSAAIENMLLAISALGYASCWIEGYVRYYNDIAARMAEILEVPEEYSVAAYLPVGIPVEEGKRVEKKPFAERSGYNKFLGE